MNLDALSDRAQFWANQLTSQRSLAFHYISNSVDGVAQFLGALRAGHSVALLDPNLPEEVKLSW